MKPFKSYESATVLSETITLPVGGYVCKILDVKEESTSWGQRLAIRFDIAEGDFKDFYKENYSSQTQEDKKWKGVYRLSVPKDDGTKEDDFTARIFKTAMSAIEESNKGYHWGWDETTLKDKKVGVVFQNKEYNFNGREGFWTAPHSLKSIDDIRNGKFKIPADKLLKKTGTVGQVPEGFEEMDDSDIPF